MRCVAGVVLVAVVALWLSTQFVPVRSATRLLDDQGCGEWSLSGWAVLDFAPSQYVSLLPGEAAITFNDGDSLVEEWDLVVNWPLLMLEQAVILALSGGLLAAAIRRRRGTLKSPSRGRPAGLAGL